MEENSNDIDLNNKLLENFKALNLKGDLSKEEYTEFQKLLHDHYKSVISEREAVVTKIQSEIEFLNKKKNNKTHDN